MENENRLTPGERDWERHLAGLQPAQHAIERDLIFFRAGQRVATRRLRYWQGVSSVMFLAAIGFLWWQPHSPPTSEPLPLVSQDRLDPPARTASRARLAQPLPPAQAREATGTKEYLRLREEVITKGPEVLPALRWIAPSPDGVEAVSDWRLLTAVAPSASPNQMT